MSYTHGWIFSAPDSAVRETAHLLPELGLVDEAKTVVDMLCVTPPQQSLETSCNIESSWR